MKVHSAKEIGNKLKTAAAKRFQSQKRPLGRSHSVDPSARPQQLQPIDLETAREFANGLFTCKRFTVDGQPWLNAKYTVAYLVLCQHTGYMAVTYKPDFSFDDAHYERKLKEQFAQLLKTSLNTLKEYRETVEEKQKLNAELLGICNQEKFVDILDNWLNKNRKKLSKLEDKLEIEKALIQAFDHFLNEHLNDFIQLAYEKLQTELTVFLTTFFKEYPEKNPDIFFHLNLNDVQKALSEVPGQIIESFTQENYKNNLTYSAYLNFVRDDQGNFFAHNQIHVGSGPDRINAGTEVRQFFIDLANHVLRIKAIAHRKGGKIVEGTWVPIPLEPALCTFPQYYGVWTISSNENDNDVCYQKGALIFTSNGTIWMNYNTSRVPTMSEKTQSKDLLNNILFVVGNYRVDLKDTTQIKCKVQSSSHLPLLKQPRFTMQISEASMHNMQVDFDIPVAYQQKHYSMRVEKMPLRPEYQAKQNNDPQFKPITKADVANMTLGFGSNNNNAAIRRAQTEDDLAFNQNEELPAESVKKMSLRSSSDF